MNPVTAEQVRSFLTDYLKQKLEVSGRSLPDDLSDDCDLLLSGVIDSLGLLELVTVLSERFNQQLAFEEFDPEQMTIVGPLCRFVAQQLSAK
ncbi:MAG: hypothetical protein H8K05_00205 [Nitrospira sp.]|nr:hypothetical protein [Nitrospira sp.]